MQWARLKIPVLFQGSDARVMYQTVVLNPLTCRTPCFSFVPLSQEETQARMDTAREGQHTLLKASSDSTTAAVTDFFIII